MTEQAKEFFINKYGKKHESTINSLVAKLQGQRKVSAQDMHDIDEQLKSIVRSVSRPGTSIPVHHEQSRPTSALSYMPSPKAFVPAHLPFKVRPGHLQQLQAEASGVGAPDMWGAIARFERKKFEDQEIQSARDRAEKILEYRQQLDQQLRESAEKKEAELRDLEDRRLAMAQERQLFQADEAANRAAAQARVDQALHWSNEALNHRHQQQRQEELRREREHQLLVAAFEQEKLDLLNEKRLKQEEAKRTAELFREAAIKAEQDKKMRKISEQMEAVEMAKELAAEMDRREKIRDDALQKRRNRIKSIANSLGKDLGDKQKLAAEIEEVRLNKYLKQTQQQNAIEDKRRLDKIKSDHATVKSVLDAQVRAKEAARMAQAEESKRQYERIKTETSLHAEQMRLEQEKRKLARQKQDEVLIAQMTMKTLSTADDVMNRDGRNRDVVINKGILRLMKEEGVELETVGKLI